MVTRNASRQHDDDLLWFRHHIDEADMSLRRNKPLRGVLSLRYSRSSAKTELNKKAQHKAGLFYLEESDDDLLSHTYVHYHRR